ncbi:MAG: hypothetical protein RH982_12725 [Parvibaculum sp.]
METDKYAVAVRMDQPADSNAQNRNLRRWWSIITILLVAAIFIEAVFAGAMLSGAGWARTAHTVNAVMLMASTITAGLVSVVALRHVPYGRKFGLILVSLAAAVFLQTALGILSARGANLMWVHVPLGVALVWLAAQAAAGVRKLGGY